MAAADLIAASVQDALKDGPYACSDLVKLTGGTANFVYRATLDTPLSDGSSTIVIKHTEGYVALSPTFTLTSTRCEFEQAVLTALGQLAPSTHADITVLTPHLYHFDVENNTQIYTDLPSSTDLKTYCLTHSLNPQECTRLGNSLGLWAKRFHTWGAAPEQAGVRETMKRNTAMRDLKFQINYSRLLVRIESFPNLLENSRALFEEIGKEVRLEVDGGQGTLIHGDFWSGNVILPNAPFPASPESPLKMFIIDWELSHIGSIAFDLGQMFAELFELKHFKSIDAGTELIAAFMQGYGRLPRDLAFRTAVHFGTHLICWGSSVQGWGTKEQVEKVVEIGRDFVTRAWAGDREWFVGSPLDCLFT
ncbi:hypothetical protein BP6252_00723 [Coleophoma cylindrospora]|uniref:Aminoglycoside phosphotransferase domain-containing protein n=1 Tax=Coleophoma cylindrospora TaxID=1849047 RepID=A0A3D8SR93_9HELO|nr:hypothetical protein BP6252_00723 [Coleophoma cylindrospora]